MLAEMEAAGRKRARASDSVEEGGEEKDAGPDESVLRFVASLARDPGAEAPGSSRAVRNELMELRTAMRAGIAAPQAPKRKRPVAASEQVQRPSSPSNFRGDAVEEVATLVRRKPWTPWADAGADRKRLGEAAPLKGNSQQALEDYLGVVRRMYYSPRGYPQAQTGDLFDLERRSAFGMLMSPIRRSNPIENWSPREIALFEAAICIHGKKFHEVQRAVKSKSMTEIVAFYYAWKKTAHHREWKASFKAQYHVLSS